ncbi:antibiotic biosynthesis monooxygenase [Noviluteimonas gilva]|uniref:Antibiotic biosynthesis monooxygenase n=1 Tax=Noviluteimonas gilva TaxID=2682097 RepID=A0A7C9M242_9GAMM|nr:antibiotic biosynthesis monooxygenase [Lysobacter gilvus]MUV14808.1 antibiotic biosynthesis monooxygenase [Lysobacter gilvus]
MIVRMWHGRTAAHHADAYLSFLEERAIPDYRRISGNAGVWLLRRIEGDVAHFITMTHWTTRDAIAAFAGDDIAVAKYYPEDRDFLLEFEPTVVHYEICASDIPFNRPA